MGRPNDSASRRSARPRVAYFVSTNSDSSFPSTSIELAPRSADPSGESASHTPGATSRHAKNRAGTAGAAGGVAAGGGVWTGAAGAGAGAQAPGFEAGARGAAGH